MTAARMLFVGMILLLFGVQLRLVDTFVLTDKAAHVVQTWLGSQPATAVPATTSDDLWPDLTETTSQTPPAPKREFTPPRWLGLSFLSTAAVLILGSPCFRS